MDTIRFIKFLQDFAANNVQKSTSAASGAGTSQASADLNRTISAFEEQFKALLNAPVTQTATPPSDNNSTTVKNPLLTTQAMLSKKLDAESHANVAAARDNQDPAKLSAHDETLREIIAWRREQIDPMLHVRVGDIWERQGITDPMNDPKLLADAQHSHDRAMSRKAQMPGLVAQWEGDWRAQLAAKRQNLADQRIQAAADGRNNPFVIGGGRA